MAALIRIHIRAPAQNGQSHLQALTQQALGDIVVVHALLGKGDQLQIDQPGPFRLEFLHRFCAAQLHVGVDFHVSAHRGATVPQRDLQGAPGALVHIFDREFFF